MNLWTRSALTGFFQPLGFGGKKEELEQIWSGVGDYGQAWS